MRMVTLTVTPTRKSDLGVVLSVDQGTMCGAGRACGGKEENKDKSNFEETSVGCGKKIIGNCRSVGDDGKRGGGGVGVGVFVLQRDCYEDREKVMTSSSTWGKVDLDLDLSKAITLCMSPYRPTNQRRRSHSVSTSPF